MANQALARSGHLVGGPVRFERLIDVLGSFIKDDSILEDRGSAFLQAVNREARISLADLI